MTRLPLLVLALLLTTGALAPVARAQHGTWFDDPAIRSQVDEMRHTLDALRADPARLDSLNRTFDTLQLGPEQIRILRHRADAVFADPQRLNEMRRTPDRARRSFGTGLLDSQPAEACRLDTRRTTSCTI